MNWTVSRHDLPLSAPFGISRGTSEICECVVVELTHEGTTGYGAVTPSAYFGETTETVTETLPDLLAAVDEVGDPHAGQRIERLCREVAPDQPAARSAVGIAVADWAARTLGVPLYRQWGLDPERVPATSYTVGIDPPEEMAAKAHAAVEAGFGILKLKLGSDDDRARFDAVRAAVPETELRVDANAAWDADEAVAKAGWLEAGGVTMLEQPVAADDVAGLARVTDVTTMAVCADEACQTATDIPRLADACNVVNVKLPSAAVRGRPGGWFTLPTPTGSPRCLAVWSSPAPRFPPPSTSRPSSTTPTSTARSCSMRTPSRASPSRATGSTSGRCRRARARAGSEPGKTGRFPASAVNRQ